MPQTKRMMGQVFDEALAACTSQESADAWLKSEVELHGREYGQSPEEALSIIKENLGYFAGYYSRDVAVKVYQFYKAAHPIFGTKEPTPEEAFAAGVKLGEEMRKKNG